MSNASADSPTLQAELQPSTVRLGDVITLNVEARHPPGAAVELPALQKELGTFEVYASTALAPQIAGPAETRRFQIELQNFTTGQQLLPPLAFAYRSADGKAGVLKTPEFKVMVEWVPPGPKDKGDIRGIKGVLGPVALSPWWWLLLAFAVLIGGVCLWRQRRRKIEGPPPVPPDPADQVAMERLQELIDSGWAAAGKLKEFYSGLSDVLRTYLETGFACPALERTTGELMRDLRSRSLIESSQLLELRPLLEECDLVKFAKLRPETDEALKAHAVAVRFVEKTRTLLKAPSPAKGRPSGGQRD